MSAKRGSTSCTLRQNFRISIHPGDALSFGAPSEITDLPYEEVAERLSALRRRAGEKIPAKNKFKINVYFRPGDKTEFGSRRGKQLKSVERWPSGLRRRFAKPLEG